MFQVMFLILRFMLKIFYNISSPDTEWRNPWRVLVSCEFYFFSSLSALRSPLSTLHSPLSTLHSPLVAWHHVSLIYFVWTYIDNPSQNVSFYKRFWKLFVFINSYEVMTKCWQASPNDRPKFSELCMVLETMVTRENSCWDRKTLVPQLGPFRTIFFYSFFDFLSSL